MERIQGYTRLLLEDLAQNSSYASQIAPNYIDEVCRSSLLHDIGKVGIPDRVLLKPGRLTPDEFEVMKTHAELGAEALEGAARYSPTSSFLKIAVEIARFHHERFDGSGYPTGLSGTDIPLSARVVAVADVFDALTSERVYKQAMSVEDSRQMIVAGSGSQFDPVVVEALERQWPRFVDLAALLRESTSPEPALASSTPRD